MEQILSRKVEILNIKFHEHRDCMCIQHLFYIRELCPPAVCVLCHLNPDGTLQTSFLKICSNLQSNLCPGLPNLFLPFMFPGHNIVCIPPPLPHQPLYILSSYFFYPISFGKEQQLYINFASVLLVYC